MGFFYFWAIYGLFCNSSHYLPLRNLNWRCFWHHFFSSKLCWLLLWWYRKWYYHLCHSNLVFDGSTLRLGFAYPAEDWICQHRNMGRHHFLSTYAEQYFIYNWQHDSILYHTWSLLLDYVCYFTTKIQKIYHIKHSLHQCLLDRKNPRLCITLLSK